MQRPILDEFPRIFKFVEVISKSFEKAPFSDYKTIYRTSSKDGIITISNFYQQAFYTWPTRIFLPAFRSSYHSYRCCCESKENLSLKLHKILREFFRFSEANLNERRENSRSLWWIFITFVYLAIVCSLEAQKKFIRSLYVVKACRACFGSVKKFWSKEKTRKEKKQNKFKCKKKNPQKYLFVGFELAKWKFFSLSFQHGQKKELSRERKKFPVKNCLINVEKVVRCECCDSQ